MADAIHHGKVHGEYIKPASLGVRLLFFAFVIVCIYDPANQILGGKSWLFVALAGGAFLGSLWANDRIVIPVGLLVCVALFIAIPLLSIAWYYLTNGTEPYAGFFLVRSYLFVLLAIILVAGRIDAFPFLSAALTVVSLLTIAIFIWLEYDPESFTVLHGIGDSAGVLFLAKRSYGDDLNFVLITFATSPMLAIAVPYYFDRAMSEPAFKSKLIYLTLTAINIVGLLLAGLRNTMAVAFLLPFFLWPLYTRRVMLNSLVSAAALTILSLPLVEKLQTLLSPTELSNNVKLTFLSDYATIFSDPVTLLFGQGLGAYYRWSSSGLANYETTDANFYFITELTYAEMMRSFGLLGAAVMMALLLFPVVDAFFLNPDRRRRALAIGFLAYLGMSATNPLLFSSSGLLIFSALLAATFQQEPAVLPDSRIRNLS
jgi:hypothetical protein